jgi:hypothetical protein
MVNYSISGLLHQRYLELDPLQNLAQDEVGTNFLDLHVSPSKVEVVLDGAGSLYFLKVPFGQLDFGGDLSTCEPFLIFYETYTVPGQNHAWLYLCYLADHLKRF